MAKLQDVQVRLLVWISKLEISVETYGMEPQALTSNRWVCILEKALVWALSGVLGEVEVLSFVHVGQTYGTLAQFVFHVVLDLTLLMLLEKRGLFWMMIWKKVLLPAYLHRLLW